MEIKLDHEQFEGAKVLADIGAKIASGKAALDALERSKDDFLNEREAEAIARVSKALSDSKDIIIEIGTYHSELVGYRNQVEGFLSDVLYLIQSVERWKSEFDRENTEKIQQINTKIEENKVIYGQITEARALLKGESDSIKGKRAHLNLQQAKIDDEWATIARVKKELKI